VDREEKTWKQGFSLRLWSKVSIVQGDRRHELRVEGIMMEVGPEEQMGNRDSHSPTVVKLKGGGGGGEEEGGRRCF